MEYHTTGYNGVPRWCPNMKWGRRGLWSLDLRHDSEHKGSKMVEKEAGGLPPSNATRARAIRSAPLLSRSKRPRFTIKEDEKLVDLGERNGWS